MSIQHLNNAKAIARTAKQLGATLPDEVSAALAHLESLSASAPTPLRPGRLAAELAQHLGNPAAMEKARKAATAALATSEADAKIHGFLNETCGARLRSLMQTHRDEIAASMGAALTADLDTLGETAGRLPAWFNPEQAGDLDPVTFADWSRARDAYAKIQAAAPALDSLYGRAADPVEFSNVAAASLRFAKPPVFNVPADAYTFRSALTGKAERVQSLAGQGSTFVDGIFIPAALAHAGATFKWASPDEVRDRAVFVLDGMTAQPAPVSAPAAASAVAF